VKQLRMKTFVKRADRRPVSLHGFALSPTRDCDIQLADLSYGGCKLHSKSTFKTGEIVELRIITRGAVDAEIRWCSKGRAGARFLNEPAA
jgi:hypothetical protein